MDCSKVWGIVKEIVKFLKALKAYLKQPLRVIWDGLKAHRSRLVRDYLDVLKGHIQIAFPPPYAPDLNPVEYLWAWLERHWLTNYCPNDLSELQFTAPTNSRALKSDPRALRRAGCRLRSGNVMNYGSLNNS
jgi:transposase